MPYHAKHIKTPREPAGGTLAATPVLQQLQDARMNRSWRNSALTALLALRLSDESVSSRCTTDSNCSRLQRLDNDGVLQSSEVESLKTFLGSNSYSTTFPGQQIATRLRESSPMAASLRTNAPTCFTCCAEPPRLKFLRPGRGRLTFDEPEGVQFRGKHFCFHGKFVSGSARWLRRTTEDHEAIFQEELDSFTAYVVIGSEGPLVKDFIRRVLERRSNLSVLSEKTWLELLASQQGSIPQM